MFLNGLTLVFWLVWNAEKAILEGKILPNRVRQ